jgi:hypothetical protein
MAYMSRENWDFTSRDNMQWNYKAAIAFSYYPIIRQYNRGLNYKLRFPYRLSEENGEANELGNNPQYVQPKTTSVK